MDDRRLAGMEIGQPSNHVTENRVFQDKGYIFGPLQQSVETVRHVLHHENRQFGAFQEADAQELDNVRVAEVGEERTLLYKPLQQLEYVRLVASLDEDAVEHFPCTEETLDI